MTTLFWTLGQMPISKSHSLRLVSKQEVSFNVNANYNQKFCWLNKNGWAKLLILKYSINEEGVMWRQHHSIQANYKYIWNFVCFNYFVHSVHHSEWKTICILVLCDIYVWTVEKSNAKLQHINHWSPHQPLCGVDAHRHQIQALKTEYY